MTNLEKFKEVFGDTMGNVKVTEKWAKAEYKGPANPTERDKFINWLDRKGSVIEYTKAEHHKGLEGDGIYINHSNGEPIIRVSDFRKDYTGKVFVYVRWNGLTGYKQIDDVKDIIDSAIYKNANKAFEEVFGQSFDFFAPRGGKR